MSILTYLTSINTKHTEIKIKKCINKQQRLEKYRLTVIYYNSLHDALIFLVIPPLLLCL